MLLVCGWVLPVEVGFDPKGAAFIGAGVVGGVENLSDESDEESLLCLSFSLHEFDFNTDPTTAPPATPAVIWKMMLPTQRAAFDRKRVSD